MKKIKGEPMTSNKFKNPTTFLMSALLVTSFSLVNCAKKDEKAAVRTKVTNGGANTGTANGQNGQQGLQNNKIQNNINTANLKVCSAETLQAWDSQMQLYKTLIQKNAITNKDEFVVDKIKESGKLFLEKCDEIQKLLDKESDKACLRDDKNKNPENSLRWDVMNRGCQAVGANLKKATSEDNAYAKAAQEEKTRKESSSDAFKKATLIMSAEMADMLKPSNLDFKSYIVDGVIKSGAAEMKELYRQKKTICSFVGTSTELSSKEKITAKIIDYSEKVEKYTDSEINALGMVLEVKTGDESSAGVMQQLACSNLSAGKVDIAMLKKALGLHLATEADIKKANSTDKERDKMKSDFRKLEIEQRNKDQDKK